MPAHPTPFPLTASQARRLWLRAQRLDAPAPFGRGPEAVRAAVAHLGYVQIDTIHVIERCHHHILHTRIPDYRRHDLHHAQAVEKSVFEYWTHALAYVPTDDIRYFLPEMKRRRQEPGSWFASVKPADLRRAIRLIREQGPLSIRDIDDDVLVEKDHPWASRKPTKHALQLAFHAGAVTIGARDGMLKIYDLPERHFGWTARPRPATERQLHGYILDRALRSQAVVSLKSICYLDARHKNGIHTLIAERVRHGRLLPVALEGAGRQEHWATPEVLAAIPDSPPDAVHILSPFDPLIIQRRRLALFFGYDHLFEAYLPKEKRQFGYFALPVLDGEDIVAAIDLKADRAGGQLQVQQWSWTGRRRSAALKSRIEAALHRFEQFQFGD